MFAIIVILPKKNTLALAREAMRANKKSRKIKKVSSFLAQFRFQADVLDAMNALISPYGAYLFLGGGGGTFLLRINLRKRSLRDDGSYR